MASLKKVPVAACARAYHHGVGVGDSLARELILTQQAHTRQPVESSLKKRYVGISRYKRQIIVFHAD